VIRGVRSRGPWSVESAKSRLRKKGTRFSLLRPSRIGQAGGKKC